MSYGKKKMKPEYWFSVPRNKVDEVYAFLNVWVPHLYGELNEEQVIQIFFLMKREILLESYFLT